MTTMLRRAVVAAGILMGFGAPSSLMAQQRALVYCPVGIDETGCNTIVAALTAAGTYVAIDRGYDGSGGTVDLRTVDLLTYTVVVVPSLADDADIAPYSFLRDPAVAEHLRAALIGGVAVYSGTPDQGTTSRGFKDVLIQNLAAWAGASYATAQGPGLVAFLDAGTDLNRRYDWLRNITPLHVAADPATKVYSAVRRLTPRADTLLAALGTALQYTNMAMNGLVLPAGSPGASLDAVGQTGTSVGGQVVLVTLAAGNTNTARVLTDSDDYGPGDTVTVTGTGWQPGETVTLSFHEDPLAHEDRILIAVANDSGSFVNKDFVPEDHDVSVRFVLTAIGQTSGLRAQTTFTDDNKITFSLTAGGSAISAFASIAAGVCQGAFAQSRQGSNLDSATANRIIDLGSTPTGATFYSGSVCAGPATITSVTILSGKAQIAFSFRINTAGSYTIDGDGPFTGNNDASATITVTAPANTAPVLSGVPATATINELAPYTFDANATDTQAPPQTLTFSLTGTVPAGAAIDASTGIFTWTPTEAQGPGTFNFNVRVTDNATPALFDEDPVSISVSEVNQAPLLNTIGNRNASEGTQLTFTATAIDGDLPANSLSFSLVGAPAGAAINATSGVFTWTPGESDGGTAPSFAVKVTDNGIPNLSHQETITVTVAEVNVAPVLTGVPATATIPELAPYTFDANATDADLPAQTLAFGLSGAPTGAAIDPSTGVFTWTPTEAQGPGSFTFDVTVGDGVTTSQQSVTLTVTEVNVAPVLGAIGNKNASEGTALTFTATATDADLPANTLTFSLIGAPAGATIDGSTGAFSWTPGEADGGTAPSFKVRVTDNGTGALFDEEEITVTVSETNAAPVVTAIPAKTVNELAALTFTAAYTDADTPPNTITWSLQGTVPAGATINSGTGEFSWTPTEAEGPGSYSVTVRATDNGTPAMFGETTVAITVNEVNVAPVLGAIGNKSASEGTALTFTATATDVDLPANTLTFSLIGAPAGATINGSTGEFSWTPGENDGGTTPSFKVRVTDNGTGALFDEEQITVTVAEVNSPPVVTAIPDKEVNEETALTFTAHATDPDIPANTFTWSLSGTVPAGATINSTTGDFSWTPTEAQGPGVYNITVRATDNGTPAEFGETIVKVTVKEVNLAPVLVAIGNKDVDEETALTFTATATDPDLPPNTLTFSLIGAPAGATISAAGAFSWTPTEAQGPNSYTFKVRVTDDGTPAMYDEEEITVTVKEVNKAPVPAPIPDKTVDEHALLSFTATATDPDIPANTFTWTIHAGGLTGMAITSAGAFTWTPSEAQGPGDYEVTLRATDNGTPPLPGDVVVKIHVNEVNEPPVLAAIGNKQVDEETALTFTATATDPDLPPNSLTFSLIGAPAGAAIDPTTGAFNWTPTEAQGPNTYTFKVRVNDNGTPNLQDEEEITVTVKEVNKAPVPNAIAPKVVDEKDLLSFSATATDPDIPANDFTWSIASGMLTGMAITSAGAFTWTPTEAQGPGVYNVTLRATDDGTPPLYGDVVVQITVNEVNEPPVLAAIGDKQIDEEAQLTFTATATDPDLPPNTLSFSLIGAPAGAAIDPGTGAFTWTPTEAQGPNSYTFKVRVTDNGTPAMYDEEQITVTVKEVNKAPVPDPIADKTIDEKSLLSFAASATDPDIPANTFTWSIASGGVTGMAITSAGAFTWTPTEAQGPGVYNVTLRATDNGTPPLGGDVVVKITVNEVNEAPELAPIGNKNVNELVALGFTASATDPDLPANTLSYSLVGAPGGATINSSTGVFSWTPTEAQGPGSYTFTVKVTDNGTPALSDEEAITVTVAEVNVAPILASIGNKSVNWGDPLGFTAGATDADVPANTLTYELTGTVPAGATINGTTGLFSWTPTAGQVGSHTFNVRVYDNGSPVMADYEAITVTVGKRPTTLVYDGATTSQYSDQAVASATLKDTGLGTAIAGRTVGFTLGSQTGSGSTDASGKGIFTFTLNQAVGSYTMQSSFAGDAAYQQSSDSDGFTITTEDVIHSYSGFMLFNTADISISTATLNLQATLRDPTAVSGDPKYDAFAGDVRTAQAKFVVRDADTDAFVGECNAGAPTPITPGDNKVATVSCNVPVNIGSEDDKEYKVITLVGPPDRAGNYQGGDPAGDFVMVAVVRPYPGSVSGGGYLVNPSLPPGGSAGTYAVDVGKKTNFGFSVRNNKSGKSMQGHVNIILRKGGKLYQIKTTSVTTFTPVTNGTGGTANFETKANLTDLTTGASTGNLTLKMVVIDKGEPGKDDTIEITLWNGGTLWYSSKWDGAKTVAALLTGGNLQVR